MNEDCDCVDGWGRLTSHRPECQLMDLEETYKSLQQENKRLKDILLACLPALRLADKSCYDLFPREGTSQEFLHPGRKDCIFNWAVREAARKALGVDP